MPLKDLHSPKTGFKLGDNGNLIYWQFMPYNIQVFEMSKIQNESQGWLHFIDAGWFCWIFIPQIFTGHLVWPRHCSRCWGYKGNKIKSLSWESYIQLVGHGWGWGKGNHKHISISIIHFIHLTNIYYHSLKLKEVRFLKYSRGKISINQ